ncbi:MAG: hypothetical protein WD336_08530 [Trueperaceae bacterium]
MPLSYLSSSGIDRTGTPWSWAGKEWDEQLDIIANELARDTRLEAVRTLSRLGGESAGEIWLGDVFSVVGVRDDVHNAPDWHYMRLFDVWLD